MMKSAQSSTHPGRPREFDVDHALDKAIAHFSEYGFHGTSIADLNTALALTSGSIYKAWGDKRGLFLATLDHYIARRAEAVQEALAGSASGREKVDALLNHYAHLSSDRLGRTGCLVIETAVELSVTDAEIATRIAAQHLQNESRLRRLINEGQQDGSIRATLDAAVTARLLLAILQGMRVLGKSGAALDDMQQLARTAMHLID